VYPVQYSGQCILYSTVADAELSYGVRCTVIYRLNWSISCTMIQAEQANFPEEH